MTTPTDQVEAKERLKKLSNWLANLRMLASMSSEVGQAYAGIVKTLEKRDVRPEQLHSDLRALLQENEELRSRATKAEGENSEPGTPEELIQEARRLVNGERNQGYGSYGPLTRAVNCLSAALPQVSTLTRQLTEAREERGALTELCRDLRDRLLAFVGALALSTDCSADVDAIRRADAALSKVTEV